MYFFFFNDTATTEIYTLSLHDALPIFFILHFQGVLHGRVFLVDGGLQHVVGLHAGLYVGKRKSARAKAFFQDRKSTRLNSSHANISYAVFCLKKKKYNPARQH